MSGSAFDYFRWFVSYKNNDNRDDFDFDIVNFPFLKGDVPRATSYGFYIYHLIRFARVSSHVADINTNVMRQTAGLMVNPLTINNFR